MKSHLIFSLMLIPFCATTQMVFDSITDERDGHVYRTVQIDSLLWFHDNLMLETNGSYCPNDAKKHSKCSKGNYYPYTELENICPNGWRLPDENDWHKYFNYRLKDQKGSIEDVTIDSLNEDYLTLIYTDTNKKVNLFEEHNPLGLDEFGWVEGHRLNRKRATATIWIKNSMINDDRFHLHISNNNFVYHRHKHNIDDVKKKSRRFMVKCVSKVN